MTTVNLQIKANTKSLTDNNARFEVARILRQIARDIEHGEVSDIILDEKNVIVGLYEFIEAKHDN